MKHRIDIKSAAIGALLSIVAMLAVAATNKERMQWEYTVQYDNSSHPDMNAANKLGGVGWEAVGAFSWPDSKGFIFKRQK